MDILLDAVYTLGRVPKSLETLLMAARCQNIVVVAASGNDSALVSEPRDEQIPAVFPQTIGVAASSMDGGRSCFSNKGLVAAPGGNKQRGSSTCQPDPRDCKDSSIDAVIGPVLKSAYFPSGYACWRGTSFSTPLVSGLAALMLQKEGVWPTKSISETILEITCPSKDGSPPIINVPHALLGTKCLTGTSLTQ